MDNILGLSCRIRKELFPFKVGIALPTAASSSGLLGSEMNTCLIVCQAHSVQRARGTKLRSYLNGRSPLKFRPSKI